MDFNQNPPEIKNTYENDPLLKKWLKTHMPAHFLPEVERHLRICGQKAITDWLMWSQLAESEPPQHVPFNAWGQRIDQIKMSQGWTELEKEAAVNGLIAIGYERQQKEHSRLYQMALLYLFHPSSAFVSCPLAMTDGAARALELYGSESQKKRAFQNLISRDPEKFWTSGQWMTEKTGGSDVSGTSTIATRDGDLWRLNGIKWFTSATTSQMACLLARPEGAEEGSRGLSLFYLELRDEKSNLQNIEILRLKDKLGTKALPTAELQLKGARAELVGDVGSGVKKISSLFNITRVYNSVCATAHLRRAIDLAQDYCHKRKAFGNFLIDLPLMTQTLSDLEKTWERSFKLTFYLAELLGRDETGVASEQEQKILRGLTPLVKLYTAKKCMWGVSEVIEIFGGVGYCEDSGLPRLLRDAQVFSIWEGATNVLLLDFLRAVQKENVLFPILEKAKCTDLEKGFSDLQNLRENSFRLIERLADVLD